MQRIKRIRWPTRNPMGDVLTYKVLATYGSTVTIASGTSNKDIIPSVQFNNMPTLASLFGDAPGLVQISANYDTYRVSGIRVKHTIWPLPAATDVPVYVYTDASHDPIGSVPSITVTPEQRWTKSRIVKIASNGANPTTISQYYSVNKIEGPDRMIKNDADYTALCGPSNSPGSWSGPLKGPYMRTGFYTMTGANTAAAQTATVKTEFMIYLKFWGKRRTIS